MIYEFICRECSARVVIDHPLTQAHPRTHAGCGGRLRRSFTAPNIVYRGSGFFTTDKALYPKEEIE